MGADTWIERRSTIVGGGYRGIAKLGDWGGGFWMVWGVGK